MLLLCDCVCLAFLRSVTGKTIFIYASKIVIATVAKLRPPVNMYVDSSFSMFPPKPAFDKIIMIHLVKGTRVSIIIITMDNRINIRIIYFKKITLSENNFFQLLSTPIYILNTTFIFLKTHFILMLWDLHNSK